MTEAKPPPPPGEGRGPDLWQIRRDLELGAEMRIRGDLEMALTYLSSALAGARQTGDAELHLSATREFGLTLLASSRLSEAEAMLGRVLREISALHGEDSPRWVAAAEELALARRARGDLRGALRLQQQAYRVSARSLGRTDPVTLALRQNAKVAGISNWPLLVLIGFDKLEPDSRWSRELPDLFLRTSLSEPGWVGAKEGYFEALSEVLRQEQFEAPRADTYFLQSVLGRALTSVPGYVLTDEGLELARQVLDERIATLGLDHPQSLNSLILLARATGPRNIERAVELGRAGARLSAQTLGRDHVDTLGAYEHLADLLDEKGEREEALHLRTQNLALREADEGIFGAAQPPIENLAGTLTEPLTRPDLAADIASMAGGGGVGVDPGDEAGVGAPPLDVEGVEPDEIWITDAAALETTDAIGRAPEDDLVRRTAHVELDPAGPVIPGDRFDVGVYVDCTAPTGPGMGELVLDPPAGVTELTLRAWLVVSRHFEIEGDAIRPLPVDLREPTSPKLVFAVRAAHTEQHQDEEPQVRVLFSYLGWPSGEVRLPVPLARPASGAAA